MQTVLPQDLRTPLQVAKAERTDKVLALYDTLIADDKFSRPTVMCESIMELLRQQGLYITVTGIKYILKNNNRWPWKTRLRTSTKAKAKQTKQG